MRMKVLVIAAAFLAGISTAHAAGEKIELPDVEWSWEGPFGTFDRVKSPFTPVVRLSLVTASMVFWLLDGSQQRSTACVATLTL